MPAVQNPPAQGAPADGAPAGGKTAPPPVPFVRGALPKIMRAKQWRHTVTLGAGEQALPTLTYPAHGFLRRALVRLSIDQMTGGAYTLDGLSAAIRSANFADTGGSDIIVPLSGNDFKLLNKYVPYSGFSDPAVLFPNPLEMWLTLPIEISPRDGLGSVPNMDQASLYSSDLVAGTLAQVFAAAGDQPDVAPDLTVEAYTESWSPPQPADFGNGRGVEPQPPALNTTQYVSKHRYNLQAAGDHNIVLERRGNLIRALVFVFRDENGVRSDAAMPTAFRLKWDGREMFDMDVALQQHLMRERGGMAVDTGVMVVDFTHEFDGRYGAEMRDQWLRTLKSSTLEVDLLGVGAAGQLSVITVDVAPTGNVYMS